MTDMCPHCGIWVKELRYYVDGVYLCSDCIAKSEGLSDKGNEDADRAEADAMRRADREQIAILNGGEV